MASDMLAIDFSSHQRENNLSPQEELNSFSDFFLKLSNYLPNEDLISDQPTKEIFSNLRKMVLKFLTQSQISLKKLADADNGCTILASDCKQLMQALPIKEIKIKEAQSSQVARRSSFSLGNFNKESTLITKIIGSIQSVCKEIDTIGKLIKNVVDYEKEISGLIALIAEVQKYTKFIQKNVRESKMKKSTTLKLNDLIYELVNSKNDYDNSKKELMKIEKEINKLDSLISLRECQLTLLNVDIARIKDQATNLNGEINNITRRPKQVKRMFEKKKENFKDEYENSFKQQIKERSFLKDRLLEAQKEILENFEVAKTKRDATVNFLVMIDRSGSMSNQIAKVNLAGEKFFNNLKEKDVGNFYCSVIYFNHQAIITADTVKMSTTTNFKLYLNLDANGGTSYFQGFQSAYNIIENSKKKGIEKIFIIKFTDGEDGDVYENSYSLLKNMKSLYGSNIYMFIRGLGSFSKPGEAHLQKLYFKKIIIIIIIILFFLKSFSNNKHFNLIKCFLKTYVEEIFEE